MKNLIIAEKYNDNIKTYRNMLRFIEKYKFKSRYVMNLCRELYSNNGLSASKQVDDFEKWINIIGEFEALCSIANIKYDNPQWSMPRIVTGSSRIMAKNMGHLN